MNKFITNKQRIDDILKRASEDEFQMSSEAIIIILDKVSDMKLGHCLFTKGHPFYDDSYLDYMKRGLNKNPYSWKHHMTKCFLQLKKSNLI